VSVGSRAAGPVVSLPHWDQTIKRYMALPESGFDRPFFIGQGTQDASTPAGFAAEYVDALEQNGEPVTFKSYDDDHLGTWIEAQRDEIPFVRRLFARKGG
jgi:predicted esterase